MFEKEAEVYATRECCTSCKALICKEKCECWTFAKKGAEFGYSKSNERLNKAKELLIGRSVYSVHNYDEDCGDGEVREDTVIREDYGEWREPLVEVEE